MDRAIGYEQKRPLTLREYMRLPEDDRYRDELVRGWVVREPRPAALHARLVARLSHLLDEFVQARGLGVILTEGGFLTAADPPTVRGPDVGFVSRARIPRRPGARVFWRMAPDLAVEVLSPSNRRAEILEKTIQYLDAGARAVWIIDPRKETVVAVLPSGERRLLKGDDVLGGGDVLPGFRLPLPELFDLWPEDMGLDSDPAGQ